MLSIDDRAGNVMTTVAVFVIAAAVLYLARGAVFILVLSLLFAYLLEPTVTLIQKHSRLGQRSRTWAIAQVYLAGVLLLGSIGYAFGPLFVGQVRSLNAALPQILEGLSDGKAALDLGSRHGLNAPQQQRIHDWLAHNHDFITGAFERGAASAANAAASAVWLFAVPILAIFILRDGRQMADSMVQTLGLGRNQSKATRVLGQVDTMLAKYVRGQLTLAGFSVAFYSAAMLLLGFPYAVALGAVGGALEFLPAVGWVLSAAAILTIGFLTHAHWIWMAALLGLWRLVQAYVISPRIMGNNLQLQPLTVLFVLMVGGQVGGIAGLYLSVPIAAVLRIVWLGCFSTGRSSDALSEQPLAPVEAPVLAN
jgi:predicted PurR-regulated permease PerM